MNCKRLIPTVEFELRRAVKAGTASAADWREMLAWVSGGMPDRGYEWARWLDMAAAALVTWVNAWQESIDAGRQANAETLAKLIAHRDGLRALRSQLYLLGIANAREQIRALPRPIGEARPRDLQFTAPTQARAASHQGSLL